jgi:hypothetical protein
MATYLRTKVVTSIGTTAVDALQTVSNNRFTIIGCNLANTTENNVTVDIMIVDATSTIGYYVKGVIIPANYSLKVITNGEKLILGEQCGIRIVSDTASSIDAVISYAEIV